MTQTEYNLKPCPFCGAPAYMWKCNMATYIQCSKWNTSDDLGHLVQVSRRTEEEAVAVWNTRIESEGKE